LKPSEFWESSIEDKIYMTAKMLAHYEIRAVEEYEMQKEIERERNRSGRR